MKHCELEELRNTVGATIELVVSSRALMRIALAHHARTEALVSESLEKIRRSDEAIQRFRNLTIR